MSNHEESGDGVGRVLADLQSMIERSTRTVEREMDRLDRIGIFGSARRSTPPVARQAVADMDRLADYLRTEAAAVAVDVAEGMADVVDEVARFIAATFPGAGAGFDSAARSFRTLIEASSAALDPTGQEAQSVDRPDDGAVPASAGEEADANRKPATKKSVPKKAGSKKKSASKKSASKKAGSKKKPASKKSASKKSASKKAGSKKKPATKKA